MLPPSHVPPPSGNPRRRPAVNPLKLDPAPPPREASDGLRALRGARSAVTLRRRSDPAPRLKERSPSRMAKKRSEPRRVSTPTQFEQARDELFSHILRCGVLEAAPEHQKEWFDDTMLYLTDRYPELREGEIAAAGPGRAILPARRREGSPRRRRRLTRDGASRAPRRAPVLSAPPCRKPTPPPPRDGPDAAREPKLPVPPLRPSGRRLEPHHQHHIPVAVCPRGPREPDAEAALAARAAGPRRAQQDLRGGGESHAGPSLVGPARRP